MDLNGLHEIADYTGYAFMGLVGLYGAWRKTRLAKTPVNVKPLEVSDPTVAPPEDRVERIEIDVSSLRMRQDQMQQETNGRQSHILKQQTAMFDLLVQQRSILDKILTKMTGL